MKGNEQNPIDDLFKDHFNDFTPPTSNKVWNKIDEDLTKNSVDQVFKEKLGALERDPSPEVWARVKKDLPLSLYLRNSLNFLTKVAAILLIAVLSFVATDYYKQSQLVPAPTTPTAKVEPKAVAPIEIVMPDEAVSFVLEIEDDEKVSKKKAKKVKTEIEENANTFLADLLADDDDLDSEMDEERMKALLQPLEQLPLEGVVDVFGESTVANAIAEEDFPDDYTEDLQIWVPIKFIEEHEVEEMISAYNNRLE